MKPITKIALILMPAVVIAIFIYMMIFLGEQPPIEQSKVDGIDTMVREFFNSGSFPSLSIGLVKDDTLVYTQALGIADKETGRPATIETIYELGSVGKVLTSTVLAILNDRGVVRIDDPVQKWVPAISDIPKQLEDSPQMRLEHLATHTSGLPGIPSNVDHLPPFQWKDYSPEQLHEGFKKTELLYPVGKELVYSTLGMGLLGHVLATAARKSYDKVIEDELLIPLEMNDTVITLREDQEERYSIGYESNESLKEVPYYEYGILAGGGAHRSTVPDMARFLKAQWGLPINNTNPLNKNVRSELHRIRWTSEDRETMIALGWFAIPHEGIGTLLVHRGRTPGHGAVVGFIPEKRAGVIVFSNRGGRDANIMIADFAEKLLLELLSDN
jgi:CubicO group peptidase (beta-lactamase class C family)